MIISDFFELKDKEKYINQIETFEWGAAKFLAKLLKEDSFHSTLGDGTLFLLLDGEKIVSFVTLTNQDCIDDKRLFPWLGFLYTAPEYRGNRYSEKIIKHACAIGKKVGFKKIYLATDHIGFYEKYGFEYIENRLDIYGDDSRIYCLTF